MGSKRRIVNDILPIILEHNTNNIFVDLFCGSCSVIQNVPITYKRIANDKNKYLIEMVLKGQVILMLLLITVRKSMLMVTYSPIALRAFGVISDV